jgi:8-oxo-dGTP pyrophosphatase MutT (NUDIX family)
MWSFPSGKIEDGEEPIDAAVREFFEETDIKITTNDLSFISIIYGVSGKVHLYQLKSDNEIYPDLKNAKDGNEHTECQYFTLINLPEISGDLKKVLEILL